MKRYTTCKNWDKDTRSCKLFGYCDDDLQFPCDMFKKQIKIVDFIIDNLFIIVALIFFLVASLLSFQI